MTADFLSEISHELRGPSHLGLPRRKGEGDGKGYACRGLLDRTVFVTSKLIVKGKLNFKSNGRHSPKGHLFGLIANSSFFYLFIFLAFMLVVVDGIMGPVGRSSMHLTHKSLRRRKFSLFK